MAATDEQLQESALPLHNIDHISEWTEEENRDTDNDQHFTLRAVAVGLAIGTLMCFSNMYFGLQTGWISMMSLQSSLLGFAIFKPLQPFLKTRFGLVENVVLQTTAVATATMPLAAGFVGVIPALEILSTTDNPRGPIILSARDLILWSLGVAFFGVFFAIPLRKQTIIRERLRFPSGTATAQMISLLHQKPDPTQTQHRSERAQCRRRLPRSGSRDDERVPFAPASSINNDASSDFEHIWSLKLRALAASFSLSSLYTVSTYFFPVLSALPIFNWLTFNWIDFRAWEWYFSPSLSYVGQGIIMGLPTTLSMLLGCIVGWGMLSPLAHFAGWAPGPVSDWKTGSKGWILWISLGIMIADSVLSLGSVLIRTAIKKRQPEPSATLYDAIPSTVGDDEAEENLHVKQTDERDAPVSQQVPHVVTVTGLLVSTALCVYMVRLVFGEDTLPLLLSLLAVLAAMLLSVLAVRALGETDLNPVSGIGKISQVLFALVMPGNVVANLVAGGIAEAGAQQAGDLMQDLKTGHLLGASPRAQFYGQVIGSCVSAFIATFAYVLYRSVYSIPGPEFPVPTAQVWLDMARLVNGHPLPPHVTEFVLLFALLFGAIAVIKETIPEHQKNMGWRRYLPQGIAFAVGMYNPPSFTLARVIGGFLGYGWNSLCETRHNVKPQWLETYRSKVGKVLIIIIASGFVLGEGTFAIVNMMMRAYDVPVYKAAIP